MGVLARVWPAIGLTTFLTSLEPLGTIFIRLITMVVVPLVVASLFVGVTSLGDLKSVGRIGGKTLIYFAATTLCAAVIGVVVASIASVGATMPAADVGVAPPPSAVSVRLTFVQTLVDMTPQNIFASAAAGDLLPLIVAVCLFAAAATAIAPQRRAVIVGFFAAINDMCMVVIGWVMKIAPLAVFVLIASLVAKSGVEVLRSLATFIVVVIAALAAHVLIVLIPALKVMGRRDVPGFFRTVADALLLAFSTASSSATLPVSMAAAARLGVPEKVTSFVLPAGATLNKNGAAVYKAVTAVFLAHVYGVTLGGSQLFTIVVTSALAASAGAGVPGSSLVTTMIVLNAIGLGPQAAAGIALVAGVDRPLDMCRTTVNTIGNLVGTTVIARTEPASA